MSSKPSILLIMADQLRADALGCYGNQVCRTPSIDALARVSTVFERGFTPDPICVPARAAMTTGNYPHLCTGVKANAGSIRPDQVKLAEHFASFGYRTHACGKLHYVPYSPPGRPRLTHGFETWDAAESGRIVARFSGKQVTPGLEDYLDFLEEVGWGGYSRAHGIGNNDVRPCRCPLPPEYHVDHWVADCTIRRLREHVRTSPAQPFLIKCSFPKPHSPLDPPRGYDDLYDPRQVPPPAGSETDLADRNPRIEEVFWTHAMDSLSPQARRVAKAYYYGLITFQDAQIGRVLSALEDCGAADNTIVLYTADHGDLMGDFGGFFKGCFLEGSVRVPFILRAPGIASGRRKQLVGLQDILPTLAALTGCPLTRPVQGLDLTDALKRADAPLRDVYYAQCGDRPKQAAMLFDGRWKYCWSQWGPTEELYDLHEDPRELRNLAVEPGMDGTLRSWRKRLVEAAQNAGDTALLDQGGLAISPLDREALRHLPVQGMGWRWY